MAELNFRRMLIGKPLATKDAIHERLNIPRALAVFSSDALSSTTYATEAILLVLIAAGAVALTTSLPIAIGISLLLIIVAASYFQTIHAYPNGGGGYIVAADNLGRGPGLISAAALLIDYTLTVAVSISAGIAALTSAFPEFFPYRVPIALSLVIFITLMNLRGVKESGTFFAIPTYAYVVGIFALMAIGFMRILTGDVPRYEEIKGYEEWHRTIEFSGELTLFMILRAFAAGCTALTGIEAISNGIPAFKPPESVNAGKTLIIMVTILCAMFVGITVLANSFPVFVSVHAAESGEAHGTVLSQLTRIIVGGENVFFYYIQLVTLLILTLAANTAYADFPRLASLIARDRYLPRQLTNLGDRLVFSNGILMLSFAAALLIVIFDAREHNLLPLYAVGVFLTFTMSQAGMVIHWLKLRHEPGFKPTNHWYGSMVINAVGAVLTGIVFFVLLVTKFTEGAWLVAITIPSIIFVFLQIHSHYQQVAKSLTLDGLTPSPIRVDHPQRSSLPVVVLMNSLNRCSLQSLEYAMRLSSNVRVVSIQIEDPAVERLKQQWKTWQLTHIPLDVIDSPYREVGRPLIEYLHRLDDENTDKIPTMVVIPQFVVRHWWENYLHNQTTAAIRDALYHDQITKGRGRPVIEVPYRIGDERYEPGALRMEDIALPIAK